MIAVNKRPSLRKLNDETLFYSIIPALLILYFFHTWYEVIGALISLVLFVRFILRLGVGFPFKELIALILILQYLITPYMTYRLFNNNLEVSMSISEDEYFYHVVPMVVLFLFGLFIPIRRSINYEQLSVSDLQTDPFVNPQFAKILIIVGSLSSILVVFAPPQIFFLLYLLQQLRFIGIFYILFSNEKNKWIWIAGSFTLFLLEILSKAMFYDLFIWGGILFIYYDIKKRTSMLFKINMIVAAFLSIYVLQSIKGDYREMVWDSEAGNADFYLTFSNLIIDNVSDSDKLFQVDNLQKITLRLNQGWILTKTISNVPHNVDFANGELILSEVSSALLPRLIHEDKISTGGEQNQEKFETYTGRRLTGETTMRLGALADAYVNFGLEGSLMFLFAWGLFCNILIHKFYKYSKKFALLILWIPFVLSYVIRMTDFVVVINFVFKSLIVLLLIHIVSKYFYNKSLFKASLTPTR